MAEAVTHTIVTPWPMENLHTWCGRPIAEVGGYAAFAPDAVTCPRCACAMRAALRTLTEWVPGLPRPPVSLPEDEHG